MFVGAGGSNFCHGKGTFISIYCLFLANLLGSMGKKRVKSSVIYPEIPSPVYSTYKVIFWDWGPTWPSCGRKIVVPVAQRGFFWNGSAVQSSCHTYLHTCSSTPSHSCQDYLCPCDPLLHFAQMRKWLLATATTQNTSVQCTDANNPTISRIIGAHTMDPTNIDWY